MFETAVQGSQEYRRIVKEELERRRSHNPSYSLRAFARDLELAPSRVSRVINGKEGFSRKSAEKTARLMGLGPEQIQNFCQLVEESRKRNGASSSLTRPHF